jgi:GNAT superfamily N-acetyltransferase
MILTFHPLTPKRWPDLVALFGARGACGGCWCMAFRRSRSEWAACKGEKNKRSLKRLVDSGPPPGVLAYDGATPVGWCAIAPKADYPVLLRSRLFGKSPIEDVWSVSCFFIASGYRRKGVSTLLLKAAVKLARAQGAKWVEGYPQDISRRLPDPFVWTGLLPTFLAAGFREVERRSRTRPRMIKAC